MSAKQAWRIGILIVMLGVAPALCAQQQKALTNEDVVKMVKAKLAESVVVATIQANPGKFDTSPNGLIALQKAGVTQNEMNAIVTAAQGSANSDRGAAASATAADASSSVNAASTAKSRMPSVTVIQSGSSQLLPLEKTQLAQTKTKPTSMASLASDSVLTQAIQAGVGTATINTAAHINSGVGSSTVQQAGSIFSGMLARRKPTVTYVWGVPGPASANVLQTTMPKFKVSYARTPGVNPEEFAPSIVKLTPAQNTCRLVGATRGKEDAQSGDAADWEIYSSFLEDRVAVNAQKNATGEYDISPEKELLPGEYAIVLRPVSKTKKFSGGDVARAQGDGLMFDAVWTFEVADDAQ